jgi:hypothetical protein
MWAVRSGRGADRLARLHGVQEVGGSNPLAPTTIDIETYPNGMCVQLNAREPPNLVGGFHFLIRGVMLIYFFRLQLPTHKAPNNDILAHTRGSLA